MIVLEEYRKHVEERAAEGIVPKPLSADQVAGLVELLKNPPAGEDAFLLDLLTNRVPAGVDEAAYVKAAFLTDVAKGNTACGLVSRVEATRLLGTMLGGYNIPPLVELLDDAEVGKTSAEALKTTLLMFDAFHDVEEKRQAGNPLAQEVMESWANAEWFLNKPEVPAEIKVTVYKVPGETNTDDLSPAVDAWSRPDIPLHAQAMLNARMDKPLETIEELKKKGNPLAYVGDVVGTGSSRKSATNSVLWHMGDDIPFVPNKRSGGVCIGGKIAPIFFNTMEDAGALPIECDVTKMNTGDVILDEVRAGGRIPLIVGRGLTTRARDALALGTTDFFRTPKAPVESNKGYTLAQKMVGKACGVEAFALGHIANLA
jgi:aconitate hydratase 2/2-methylisocitrate dehydratase